MECNKDEAAKAKGIAEKKLVEGDIPAAKKFALKAQKLFPELEGLHQFMATLDVYISADKRINGEVDLYGVLGVDPTADDEMLKKQYRKLAPIIHPNNNKSVGENMAFKILSEAWSLLSDKAKRATYDQKRNLTIYQTGNSSIRAGKNGFQTFTHNNNSGGIVQMSAANRQPTPNSPVPPRPNTFWTACSQCKMEYVYLRNYLNQNLLCPSCKHLFNAIEMPVPPTDGMKQQNVTHFIANYSSEASQFKISTSKKKGGRLGSISGSGSGKGDRPLKIGRFEANVTGREMPNQMERANEEIDQGIASEYQKGRSGRESIRASGTIRNTSAREMEIWKKLNEWSVAAALKVSIKDGKKIEMENPKAAIIGAPKKATCGKIDINININTAFVDTKKSIWPKKSSLSTSNVDSDEKQAGEVVSMSVPDSDYYDFDKDRIEKSFGANQVWAAYDDEDGMPRYYALIHNVISKRHFKMQISWLNSKSNAEFGPLNWVGSGFTKTTGDFRIGRYQISKNLNSFSHKVKWVKGQRGVVQIFPKRGDVWALYKNWSPEWNELTPKEVLQKYDMIEVFQDYNEEQGVTVVPLVKVAGFKSIFRQNLDPEEVKTIPREEMFRFSHQVPSYIFTGQEAQNAPKGYRELDPAALPSELLEILTEANVEDTVDKAKSAMKGDARMIEDFKNADRKATARNEKEMVDAEMVKSTCGAE
ncbi:hypothetical protein U1Q18_000058 [Sarracenia purpurea var. burkii]